jgi:DNA-binding transcriptional LysR family regulator
MIQIARGAGPSTSATNIETAELLAFTSTVDAKSLSRAAAELRVPRATLGRRLARLEANLGTRLLRRTTRSLSLTDAGEVFYRQARLALEAIAQAEASVRSGEGVMRGEVRVSVPPNLDESFSEMVTGFMKTNPHVRLRVDVSTRLVDLRRDGYDVALRATSAIESGLVARTVGRHKAIAVASPSYLAEMGTPRGLRDLKRHRCLTGFARGELPQSTWPVGRGVVSVESAFSSNDLTLLRDAAVAGLGIALLPELIMRDALDSGALVPVLPGVIGAENRIAVVYVERELMPPQVRVFVEAIFAWAPRLQRPATKSRR